MKRGSAIIIALLLGSVLSGIMLLLGRMTALEASHLSFSEDSVQAYFAAMGGIEDGLLRTKKDPLLGAGYTQENPQKVTAVNLTDSRSVPNCQNVLGKKQCYELSFWQNARGNEVIKDKPLYRDETMEFNLTGSRGVNVSWTRPFNENYIQGGNVNPPNYHTVIEIQVIDPSRSILEEKVVESYINYRSDSNNQLANFNYSLTTSDYRGKILKIRAYMLKKVGDTFISINDQENLRPGTTTRWYTNITITNMAGQFDQGFLIVQAKGYFGDAKKILQAKVDTSGTGGGRVVDLFDFGIYCGEKCTVR